MVTRVALFNGKITTNVPQKPEVSAILVENGLVQQLGTDDEVLAAAGPTVPTIDLEGRRVIPGLNDSHLHVIRAGLFFNLELRWDGVPSVSQALAQLKSQA